MRILQLDLSPRLLPREPLTICLLSELVMLPKAVERVIELLVSQVLIRLIALSWLLTHPFDILGFSIEFSEVDYVY